MMIRSMMKRLLVPLALVAGLVSLPLWHFVSTNAQAAPQARVEICHIDDEASAILGVPAGHFITVAEPSLPAHEAHGDCLAEEALVDEVTGFCTCPVE
jgi:hypothetical protein